MTDPNTRTAAAKKAKATTLAKRGMMQREDGAIVPIVTPSTDASRSRPSLVDPVAGAQKSVPLFGYINPDEVVLPCDVWLPPATRVSKGCTLSTLITALDQRARADGWTYEMTASALAKMAEARLPPHPEDTRPFVFEEDEPDASRSRQEADDV